MDITTYYERKNMNKNLRLNTLIIFILFSAAAVFGQKSKNIRFTQNSNQQELVFTINQLSFDDLTINNTLYKVLNSDQATPLLTKGAPDILKLSTSLQIPEGKSVNIAVIKSDYYDITDFNLAPSKGIIYRDTNPKDVKFTFGEEYKKDEFFPGNLFQANDTYQFRDIKGQNIWLFPFQYNPVTKTLRVYKSITLSVTYKQTAQLAARVKRIHNTTPQVFESLYARNFINYQTDRYSSVKEEGKMIVIAHPTFKDEMTDFINWKNQKGQDTELFTFDDAEILSSTTKLKEFIKKKYQEENIAFVLLVGDSQHIPPLYKSGDSDAAYGQIDGNDSYPEVIIGRFSVETKADVTTMADRTIYYEKSLKETDTWVTRGLGLASDEGEDGSGDDGESDIQHMTKIGNNLTAFGYTMVDLYDPGVTSTNVSTELNKGLGVMNYVGHGADTYWVTSYFGTNHFKNLTNENKCPFIFDVACVNGNFKGKTCFAEGFTRASKNGKPTGALAIIASTINQSWSPPMDGQDEMVNILVDSYYNNIKQTFGGVVINGCMHMNDTYGSGGAQMTDTWTIFGDPSVVIRNKTPKKASINHDKGVILGENAKFNLISDVEGVLVTLSKDNKIIAKAVVKDGKIALDLSKYDGEGVHTITVTGQDIVTYISTIDVYKLYNVDFKIISAEDKQPIKDATITFNGQMLKYNRDENGAIKVIKGNYTYSIKADGYEDVTKAISINSDTKLIEIEMIPITIQSVSIYPNPASERFTIKISNNSTAKYSIINSIGCIIKTGELNNEVNNIDSNNLKLGLYFVKIQTSNSTITRRLIIK